MLFDCVTPNKFIKILPGLKIFIEQAPRGSAERYNTGKSKMRLKNLRKLLLLYSLRKLLSSGILSYAKEATYDQSCKTGKFLFEFQNKI